jgi:hypothetical protein
VLTDTTLTVICATRATVAAMTMMIAVTASFT